MGEEDERRRLEIVYSSMTEGELRKLAESSDSLTAPALKSLDTEFQRRGIEPMLAAAPIGFDVVEQQALTTIRQFRDVPEALLAKGLLEAAGIECFLADDNMIRMDWFISNLLGGIKLQVKTKDAAAANEVLRQPIPENFEVEGVGAYQQPNCPECGSLDMTFEELNKPLSYGTEWVGVPIPFHGKGWRCKSCGHQWEDGDIEDTKSL